MTHSPPLITRFHRLALDDGPGLRTTVFLKGCTLACAWCHNPENIRSEQQVRVFSGRCIACGDCLERCAENALGTEVPPRIDASACTGCGMCADACPSGALQRAGRAYDCSELVALLLEDRVFYETSEGGVTFSGGEPTLHLEYLSQAARALQRAHVHVALQTAGTFEWEPFREELLPNLDLIYFDLKLIDPEEHVRWTGGTNRTILRNFAQLLGQTRARVIARLPLVPGVTATAQNLAGIARFVREQGGDRLELLSYNPSGPSRRRANGEQSLSDLSGRPMTALEEQQARTIVARELDHRGSAASKSRPE